MRRLFIVCLLFVFSCNKTLHLDNDGWIKRSFTTELGGNFYLKVSKKPYVLKKNLIIPKGTVLIIKNGTKIILNNNTSIINNGSLFFGENNLDTLSVFKEFNFINKSFIYNSEIESKKTNNIINNNIMVFNYCYLNNLKINNNNSVSINNSFFENSKIQDNYSLKLTNSYFKNSDMIIDESILNINNSFFNNIKILDINNSNNFIINNCVFYNNSNIRINNSSNINLINNLFFNNKNSVVINNKIGYTKFYNNLFIKNKIALEIKDTSIIYIINNNFDLNKIAIKSIINRKSNKNIISKNNIYSFNNIDFELFNNSILNSYCISNKDTLKGYYNIYGDPIYINSLNYNYNLDSLSPALRSGNNNKNLGININSINNIKYLK